nr:MAG TPA: hypothetical protein [Bacteriophage sp.]
MYHFADCVIIDLPFFFDWWRLCVLVEVQPPYLFCNLILTPFKVYVNTF